MTDYYFSAPSVYPLGAMVFNFVDGAPVIMRTNCIGISPGRAAVPAGLDGMGNPTAAVPAAGDPALFYLAIRTDDTIATPTGVNLVTDGSGQQVLGVFL
jgi:hypothetical protein